jgi:hypothetical protein
MCDEDGLQLQAQREPDGTRDTGLNTGDGHPISVDARLGGCARSKPGLSVGAQLYSEKQKALLRTMMSDGDARSDGLK